MTRRAPNKTEKIAACLIEIKRGKEWLVPEPLRSTGTAEEICAYVDWHHMFPHALGGDTRPQIISPLPCPAHDEETAKRTIPEVAKSKRIQRKYKAHKSRVAAAKSGEILYEPPRKLKKPFPGSRASGTKKHMDGRVTRR